MKKSSMIFVILIATSLLVACPTRTSISEITANPSKFQNKEVAIGGVVENSFGISVPIFQGNSGGIYKLDDGTGEIWVITKKGVPTKGAKVGVKGKVQTGIVINGRNYGLALIEENRKVKD